MDRLISAYRDRVAGKKLDQQVNDVYRILIFRFISSHHPISCSTFLDQFYESLAKVLGIEVVKDGGEVTWPHFVEYLLKTNPEQDVSRIRDIFRRTLDVLFNAIQVLFN